MKNSTTVATLIEREKLLSGDYMANAKYNHSLLMLKNRNKE